MRALTALATSALLMSACARQADASSERAGSGSAPSSHSGGLAATTTAAAVAAPLGKSVSGARARKLMHERHEAMEEIGDTMKLVSAELRKDSPDLAKVRAGAATFARYAPRVKGWFPPGTGPDVGKTRAKAEIWQKPQDFRAKAAAFEQSARAFDAAARGGDIAMIRAAQGGLGKSCKACHDPYRAPEE